MRYVLCHKKQGLIIMGRIGITYHEVTKAISILQSQQKNPTVDHIREVLSTGSKSTIARFLREWRLKNGLQNDDEGALPSDLLNVVKGLWGALREKADNQTAEYKKETDDKMAQLQQQISQHRQFRSETASKIHTLEEQNHQKTEEINALKQVLNAEQHEKIKITERASNLELRHQENQAENARLYQHLKHQQKNTEHYQAATQQLREEQVLLIEKQKSEYDQQLSQLRSQLELMTTEKSNYKAQCAQVNKINQTLEAEQKTLVLQNKEIVQQYSLLKITGDKIQEDYAQLLKIHQKQSLNLESKNHTVIELQLKLKSSDEKIVLLKSALSSADNKVHNLRHEHQFTSQEKANLEGQIKQLQNILSAKTGALIG